MNRNFQVAAAVAAALAGGAAYAAVPPTIADINAVPAANTLYIGGSSAIKAALTNSILNNFCGGAANATVVTSNGTNTNFLGISCTPAVGQATNAGIYNVWLRYEGGSVVGYLPIVNNNPMQFIDGTRLTANPITINGSSAANGTDDTFSVSAGGALVNALNDLGIGDVEPKALIGNNYPNDYSTIAWGAPNPAGMFALATQPLVDEVYALYVNTNSVAFTNTTLNLSQETIANLLTNKIKNWSQVFDINGNPVANAPLAVTLVNREYGSGSRAATDILIAGDSCGSSASPTTLFNKASAVRYFATGDVLKAANSLPGAITYASIDSVPGTGNQANLKFVNINGVAPSNLNAALGTYPFWVEAQYINRAAANGHDAAAVNNIVSALQNVNSTASLQDILAIPALTSANGTAINQSVHANPALSGVVPTGGGNGVTVYINPFTRSNLTCNNPVSSANTYP